MAMVTDRKTLYRQAAVNPSGKEEESKAIKADEKKPCHRKRQTGFESPSISIWTSTGNNGCATGATTFSVRLARTIRRAACSTIVTPAKSIPRWLRQRLIFRRIRRGCASSNATAPDAARKSRPNICHRGIRLRMTSKSISTGSRNASAKASSSSADSGSRRSNELNRHRRRRDVHRPGPQFQWQGLDQEGSYHSLRSLRLLFARD